MRSHLIAIVGLVTLSGCARVDSPVEDEAKPLEEFVGSDFGTLAGVDKRRLDELLAELPPLSHPGGLQLPMCPWRLWKHHQINGTQTLILFEVGVGERPGRAAIRFLDMTGQQIAAVPLYAGWKANVDEGVYLHDPTFGALIVVHTIPAPNAKPLRRQTYAICGNRLALLRLEDANGAALRNAYAHPLWRNGPPPPRRSAVEWEQILNDGDPTQSLEALTWLAGNHKEEIGDPTFPGAEDAEDVRRVQEVRRLPGVRAAVQRLAEAGHPWVREAALNAIAREDE
jgi:hypothetical protein